MESMEVSLAPYPTLKVIAYRVPKKGELYISLANKIRRCDTPKWSKRAKRRFIVTENWHNPYIAKSAIILEN